MFTGFRAKGEQKFHYFFTQCSLQLALVTLETFALYEMSRGEFRNTGKLFQGTLYKCPLFNEVNAMKGKSEDARAFRSPSKVKAYRAFASNRLPTVFASFT